MEIEIQRVDQARMNELQRGTYDKAADAGLPKAYLDLIVQEMTGGNCPICGKPWREIPVKNRFADFTYYDPDCICFPRCPRCRTSLHREISAGGIVGKLGDCNTCGLPEQIRETENEE
jgi:hypothetical protein